MKSLRKVLSCALALTMAAGMFAVPAAADEEQATEEVTAAVETVEEAPETDAAEPDANGFVIENHVLTKYTGDGGDITIPNTVEKINEKVFENNKKITSVTTVNGLKEIGHRAFADCPNLEKVVISDTVETIGESSFGWSGIYEVQMGKGVKRIEGYAFAGTKIKKIDLPEGLEYIGGGSSTGGLSGGGAFKDCDRLEEIVIPDTVTTLGESWWSSTLFANCTSLKKAVIGKGVKTIPAETFLNCTSLEEIDLKNVTTLKCANNGWHTGAFQGCSSLKTVNWGSVESIATNSFLGCSSLQKIELPDTVTALGGGAFHGCSSATVFRIPKLIAEATADYGALENLKTLYISRGTKKLGKGTFSQAPKLVDIYYGGTVEEWKDFIETNSPEAYIVTHKSYYIIHCSDGTMVGENAPQPATLTSIKVTPPTKTTYDIGETLDVTGGTVQAIYSDGSSDAAVPLTLDMCSGFDSSKVGQKTVTVTYKEKTATFKVTIKKGGAPTPPTPTGAITLNGEPVASYEAAIKSIGNKTGEFTLTIDGPIVVSKFTFPKNAKLEIIATENGSITTTAASLAPSTPLTIECPITNSKGKAIVINAKSDLSVTGGSFGNITVKGKAELTNVLVNGNVKLTAKADKFGFTTDTLTGVTATKGVSSNNNVIFADCPSLGTINVKGTVKITGEATKAVALTASSKTGISEVENLTVDKKVSIAGYLIASGLTSAGAVDVKGTATIADSTIAGKLSTKGALNVNGEVYCANAISCTQLTSTETAHLTYQSLAVTKYGIASNSADITVKVIDKRGSTVRFVAGDKKAVVVKSLKLPKGGTYNAVLLLDEDCGTGTLTFEKNKVVLK